MELIQGSETSANYNLTPGKYPEENIQYSNHGKSLKSRVSTFVCLLLTFDRRSYRGANTPDRVQCGQNSSNKATGDFKWTEVRGRDYKSSLQSYLPQEVQTCQFGMFPYWTHWTNYDRPSGGCRA